MPPKAWRHHGEVILVDRITYPSRDRGVCICRRRDTGELVEIPAPFLISI